MFWNVKRALKYCFRLCLSAPKCGIHFKHSRAFFKDRGPATLHSVWTVGLWLLETLQRRLAHMPAKICTYAGALRVLGCNQIEEYPMCIMGKPCITQRCNNTSAALSFACVNVCFFFKLISPPLFFYPFLLLCHHFCFPVYLCARACIWHLSGGLRVMPWSCHKLGHCFMYAASCPMWEAASLHVSFRATGNNTTTGFFFHWPTFAPKPTSCHPSPF